MCAIAHGIVVLIGGRGIQGAGAAMMLAAGLALVSGLIHPDDRNSELSLEAVLHRLVEMAVDLTGARYGALGVLTPTAFDRRVHHLRDPAGAAGSLGDPSTGHGLLGVLISEARPLRT